MERRYSCLNNKTNLALTRSDGRITNVGPVGGAEVFVNDGRFEGRNFRTSFHFESSVDSTHALVVASQNVDTDATHCVTLARTQSITDI